MSEILRQIVQRIACVSIFVVVGLDASKAEVPDLSSHGLLSKMTPEERYSFVAGVVEGVAFHRYTIGNKDKAAMECVYDWFYEKHDGQRTIDLIYVAFGKFPDYPPAAVVAALAKRKCGE